jgi:hypothetical protein
MDNASTSIEASHRVFPNRSDKNYIERVRYWKAQGLSQQDAEREASQPTRRRRRLYAVKNSCANDRSKSNLELDPGNQAELGWQPAALNLEPELSEPVQDQETCNLTKPECSDLEPGTWVTENPAANLEPGTWILNSNSLTYSVDANQFYACCYSEPDPAASLEPAAADGPICSLPELNLEPAANLEIPERQDSAYCQAVQVPEPGPEEIKAEVERQKRLGFMTELPAEVSRSQSASILAQSQIQPIPEPASGPQAYSTNVPAEGHDYSRIALFVIAIGCSAVLIHSLAESLGGGIWNFLIATGFEATPIALVGARIKDTKRREKAMWGALLLFILSLGLFISPQVTTIVNELSTYGAQSELYGLDLKSYENTQALINQAQANSELAEKSLKIVIAAEGENSPKADQFKRDAKKAFLHWEKLTKEAGSLTKKPHSPALSDAFISAIQTIVLRIGLFLAAFLSMYVRRSVA